MALLQLEVAQRMTRSKQMPLQTIRTRSGKSYTPPSKHITPPHTPQPHATTYNNHCSICSKSTWNTMEHPQKPYKRVMWREEMAFFGVKDRCLVFQMFHPLGIRFRGWRWTSYSFHFI